MTYTLRRATTADADLVTDLVLSRAAWLREQGEEQWNGKKDPARTTAVTVAAGETWLLWDDASGDAVGTLTMTTRADPAFWTEDELATPALYLAKLATRPDLAGQGLGALLLYAAYAYGAERGVHLLRWDVWRDNEGLQAYYAGLGATFLRSDPIEGRRTGALFEWRHRDMRRVLGEETAATLTIEAPTVVVAELPSVVYRPDAPLGTDEYLREEPAPDHWHNVDETYLAASGTGATRLTVSPWTGTAAKGPTVLFHDGARWRAHWMWSGPATGEVLDHLTPGLLYRLAHITDNAGCRAVLTGDQLEDQAATQAAAAELLRL